MRGVGYTPRLISSFRFEPDLAVPMVICPQPVAPSHDPPGCYSCVALASGQPNRDRGSEAQSQSQSQSEAVNNIFISLRTFACRRYWAVSSLERLDSRRPTLHVTRSHRLGLDRNDVMLAAPDSELLQKSTPDSRQGYMSLKLSVVASKGTMQEMCRFGEDVKWTQNDRFKKRRKKKRKPNYIPLVN